MPLYSNNKLRSAWIRQTLKLGLSAGLLAYCLTLVDLSRIPKLLIDCNWRLLVCAFLLTLAGTILPKAIILRILLTPRSATTIIRLISINLTLRFYTMILPKAIVAGIRWNKYRKISDANTAFVIVSFETLLGLTTATIFALGFMFTERAPVIPIELKSATLFLLVLFSFSSVLLFFYPHLQLLDRCQKALGSTSITGFAGRLLEKWRESVILLNFRESTRIYPVLLVAALGHLIFLTGGYILFMAMQVDVDFTAVAWIRSAVFVLVSVPISFAGIGIRELGFISLFGLYGIDSSIILAYALLALFLQTLIAILGLLIESKNWLFKN